MTGKVDLHIHTSVSDGRFSPEEIVSQAVKLGVNTIAICDHDNTDGVMPAIKAAAAFPSIRRSQLTDRAKRIRDLSNALKTRNLI